MTRIDARGLKCPWPALRAARALRGGDIAIEIEADDPAAERELAALAGAHGLAFRACAAGVYRIGEG
ncbi:sulfurtransferase TusA family protein [Sphingomonas baiyangensis]|uniref:Sulfurtransferase TusA family protein n=1 Tax=Sphingomonas baiyangensis TaxID=2572576 RepID=A0A4U1L0P4_9SPHN|nr:sulfurtransferase TusA family protein [Sphingomonas baiyangensis]TKD50172.1 sulfurtransferase TusA family protein [Sphingomonas baiyangensis]